MARSGWELREKQRHAGQVQCYVWRNWYPEAEDDAGTWRLCLFGAVAAAERRASNPR